MSAEAAEFVGATFVRSLLSLKHLGAVSQSASAFQNVCTALLAHGARNAALARLPGAWLEDLLQKLVSADRQDMVRALLHRALLYRALLCPTVPCRRMHDVMMPAGRLRRCAVHSSTICGVRAVVPGHSTCRAAELRSRAADACDARAAHGGL
jgi:hypothetical protein